MCTRVYPQTVPYAFVWTTLLEDNDIPFLPLAVHAPSGRSCPRSVSSCAHIDLRGDRGGIRE